MCVTSRFPTTSTQVHPFIVTEFLCRCKEKMNLGGGRPLLSQVDGPHPHNFLSTCPSNPYVSSTNAASATDPDFHFRPSSPRFELGGGVAMGVREVPVDRLVDRCGDISNPPRRSPSADLPAAAADPTHRRFARRRRARPIHSCAQRTGSVGSHGAGIQLHVDDCGFIDQTSWSLHCCAVTPPRCAYLDTHQRFNLVGDFDVNLLVKS